MSAPERKDEDFFHGDWGRLEQVVERFEGAWQRGERPAIDEFLKGADAEPRQLVLELAHADLEYRLKAGEPIRVESYLERFADLGTDRAGVLRLIEAEYRLRQRREPGLEAAEYLQRFPQFRPDLAQRFPGPHVRPAWQPPKLNCPHCHKSVALGEEAVPESIACPSCGGSFRPDVEPPPTARADGCPRVGQFELLEAVGQGAFGTVYRARDVTLDRVVAVKVPRRDHTARPADVDRFLREARNAARLTHPGIVPVYDVGRDSAVPYIVTAYVEGVTLAEALTRQRLEFRAAAEVIAQVAEALEHAHRHGVVHRDLKPSNIMLGQIQGTGRRGEEEKGRRGEGEKGRRGEGEKASAPVSSSPLLLFSSSASSRAFVMDFGLARRDEGETRLTLEGQILGTPAYMSPEQARGQSHGVDGRSDVYSLGVILYELLTGELPFRGVARMVLRQILEDDPRPPRALNDRIPRDLETIALKCLAKEPGRRYASAGALAVDLRRHLEGHPILARPVGRLERGWRWTRRNPRVAALTAAVFGLLVLGALGSSAAALIIAAKKSEAEENARVANARLDVTLDSLDKLVHEVQEQLQDQPATMKLRENLLQTALAGLERIAQDMPEDCADHRIASAHLRLGDLYLLLGKTDRARAHLERCRTMAAALVATDASNTRARRLLCMATAKLGDVSLREGDAAAARRYCGEALDQAQELARNNPHSVEATRDLEMTNLAAGKVYLQLGDATAAAACQRRAVELAQEVLEADPGNFDAQEDLGVAEENLGDAYLRLNQLPEAGAAYRTALEQFAHCALARPASALGKRNLAVAYERVGDLAVRSNDLQTARDHYRKAMDQRQQMVAADPFNPLYRRDLSIANDKLGELSDQLGDPRAAAGYYRKSLERLEELEAVNPTDAQARRDVAVLCMRLATATLRAGDAAAARDYRQKALTRFVALATADADNLQAQIDLAAISGSSGFAEMEVHDYAAAAHHFEREVATLVRLQGQGKLPASYVDWLGQQQQRLAFCQQAARAVDDLDFALAQPAAQVPRLLVARVTVLAGRGRHADAAATAERLRALAPSDGTNLYNVACCYALCIPGVAPGKPLDQLTAEETQTRARYLSRALQDLSEAVQRGFKDLKRLESDPDLAPLRSAKEYRQLIEHLNTASGPAKEGP